MGYEAEPLDKFGDHQTYLNIPLQCPYSSLQNMLTRCIGTVSSKERLREFISHYEPPINIVRVFPTLVSAPTFLGRKRITLHENIQSRKKKLKQDTRMG